MALACPRQCGEAEPSWDARIFGGWCWGMLRSPGGGQCPALPPGPGRTTQSTLVMCLANVFASTSASSSLTFLSTAISRGLFSRGMSRDWKAAGLKEEHVSMAGGTKPPKSRSPFSLCPASASPEPFSTVPLCPSSTFSLST